MELLHGTIPEIRLGLCSLLFPPRNEALKPASSQPPTRWRLKRGRPESELTSAWRTHHNSRKPHDIPEQIILII